MLARAPWTDTSSTSPGSLSRRVHALPPSDEISSELPGHLHATTSEPLSAARAAQLVGTIPASCHPAELVAAKRSDAGFSDDDRVAQVSKRVVRIVVAPCSDAMTHGLRRSDQRSPPV